MADPVSTEQWPTSIEGWRRLYFGLDEHYTLPETEEQIATKTTIFKRSLVTDLSTLERENNLPQFYVLSDVATLPTRNMIDLSSGGFYFIVARILSAEGDCQLDVRVGTRPATIFFFVDELQQNLTIRLTDGSGTVVDQRNLRKGDSIINKAKITFTTNIQLEAIPKVSEQFLARDITKRFLATQLRIALLIRSRNNHLSVLILDFIYRLTHKSNSATTSYIEAIMLKHINHRLDGKENVYAIPNLSMKTLKEQLEMSFTLAQLHDQQFLLFAKPNDPTAQRQAAHAFTGKIEASLIMQDQTLEEAKKEWKGKNAALQTAKTRAKDMHANVDYLHEKFKQSLGKWAQEAKDELIVKGTLAFIGLAASLASLLAGNPTGILQAPDAVKTITGYSEHLAKIKEVESENADLRQTLDDFRNIKTCIEDLDWSMNEINCNSPITLKQMIEDARSTISVTLNSQAKSVMGSPQINRDPDGINAMAAWDTWLFRIGPRMENAINKKIPFAQDCLTALKSQATLGKAICLATVAANKARQQLEQAFLHKQSLQAQYDQSRRELNKAEEKIVAFENIYAVFFDRLLRVTIDIVIQLENYKRSYKYYSLRDSAVKPGIHKSLPRLYDDFLAITKERDDCLGSNIRQPFRLPQKLKDDYQGVYEEVIRDLKSEEHRFTLTVDINRCPHFRRFCQVRVSSLRPRLVGARALAPRTPVELQIQTNGIYRDIDGSSQLFNFSTTPLSQGFNYLATSPEEIQFDMKLSDENHILPTPFTDWTISIKNYDKLDLSELNDVTFDWEGDALLKP